MSTDGTFITKEIFADMLEKSVQAAMSSNTSAISAMDLTSFATLAASIAACVSAVMAYRVLKEMQKQRQESSKPVLIASSNSLITKRINPEIEDTPLDWCNIEDHDNDEVGLCASLEIANIGLASAIDVKFIWDIDYDDFIKETLMVARKSLVAWDIVINGEEELVFRYKDEELILDAGFSIPKKQAILPLSQNGVETELTIPDAYLTLVSLYCALQAKNKVEKVNLPCKNLFLEIYYKDINGVEYFDKVMFLFNIWHYAIEDNSTNIKDIMASIDAVRYESHS
ncbi:MULTISPECIES: hypothetical protein [Vibrio]|uniref:hypothetical protein n=2 Tax=Vibrionaceae TaxID=641 RepID=UPI0002D7F955|nr:hypothetical protein [Vibrio tasmaniensis]OEF70494.1 hypothetical protein A152_16330 [Vibrio tasmaniensis 1F-187]OEF87009.1 hypothetical protein A162_08840 [Vibrio tasmaniensis 1F-155]PMO76976.1 hypothetical protein BCT01_15260 [Vibrio tasmaniensis]